MAYRENFSYFDRTDHLTLINNCSFGHGFQHTTPTIDASCPGKMLLVGGHCILDPTNEGLVFAVNAYATASASLTQTPGQPHTLPSHQNNETMHTNNDTIHPTSPQKPLLPLWISLSVDAPQAHPQDKHSPPPILICPALGLAVGPHTLRFVTAAAATALHAAAAAHFIPIHVPYSHSGQAPPPRAPVLGISLRIHAHPAFYTTTPTQRDTGRPAGKSGLGSSAAVTAAVTAALLRLLARLPTQHSHTHDPPPTPDSHPASHDSPPPCHGCAQLLLLRAAVAGSLPRPPTPHTHTTHPQDRSTTDDDTHTHTEGHSGPREDTIQTTPEAHSPRCGPCRAALAVLFRSAMASHCTAQGGIGSGFDIGAALAGTGPYRRPDPHGHSGVSDLSAPGPHSHTQPQAASSPDLPQTPEAPWDTPPGAPPLASALASTSLVTMSGVWTGRGWVLMPTADAPVDPPRHAHVTESPTRPTTMGDCVACSHPVPVPASAAPVAVSVFRTTPLSHPHDPTHTLTAHVWGLSHCRSPHPAATPTLTPPGAVGYSAVQRLGLLCIDCGTGGADTPNLARHIRNWRESHRATHGSDPPQWTALCEANRIAVETWRRLCGPTNTGDTHPAQTSQSLSPPTLPTPRLSPGVWGPRLGLASEFGIALRYVRRCFRALGVAAGVPLEPATHTPPLDYAEALDGVVAAGCPGAGGPDAAFVLCEAPSLESVADELRNHPDVFGVRVLRPVGGMIWNSVL